MTDSVNSDDGYVTFASMIDSSRFREGRLHKYDKNVHLAAVAKLEHRD